LRSSSNLRRNLWLWAAEKVVKPPAPKKALGKMLWKIPRGTPSELIEALVKAPMEAPKEAFAEALSEALIDTPMEGPIEALSNWQGSSTRSVYRNSWGSA
jgi:hypothetical protein